MRYTSPELRDRLAAEYVLGTMPVRVRLRFERLMNTEPDIQSRVAEWNLRLAPLAAVTAPETPPARVWQAIERWLPAAPRDIAPRRQAGIAERWLEKLAFWRGLAVAASGALAAAVLYIWLGSGPGHPSVVAILADPAGDPVWLATRNAREVRLSAMRPISPDPAHSLELWGIASGEAPRALGLLPQTPDQTFVISSADLPPAGGVLAVTREPPNGSPTGRATGPILWQGKTLDAP
ncbi:MAG: anti-sigma factor [Alphaproteobacteria bacterium]|nr:anti-sigma factor [Alphaproteobacteria bacterium]